MLINMVRLIHGDSAFYSLKLTDSKRDEYDLFHPAESTMSRKPARNAAHKHFQSAGIVYRGAWRTFLHPPGTSEGDGRGPFSISRKAIIGVAAPIRQARERARARVRYIWAGRVRYIGAGFEISEILACRGPPPPVFAVRKKEVANLPSQRQAFTSFPLPPPLLPLPPSSSPRDRRTPLTDAVSTPSFTLNFAPRVHSRT